MDEVQELRVRVRELEVECDALKREVAALKHFDAEIFIAELTGGTVKAHFHDQHDVPLKNGLRLQVKYSHINKPSPSKTMRWNWGRLLGLGDRGGDYDYLVLVGEKDPRYGNQYFEHPRFAFFLLPRSAVGELIRDKEIAGKMVALSTNLDSARSTTYRALKPHLVCEERIRRLAQEDAIAGSRLPS